MQRIFSFSGTALCLILLSACSATDPANPAPLTLRFDMVVNGQAFTGQGTTVYTLNNRSVYLTAARFYVANVTLIREDGSEVIFPAAPPLTLPARDGEQVTTVTVDRSIHLVRAELGEREIALGDVPSGRYKGVRVTFGVPGLINNADPSAAPATHPLAKQTDVNNHWSWSSGYIFIRLDGRVDLNQDGTPEEAWNAHMGFSQNLPVLEFTTPFEILSGEAQKLGVRFDAGRLMQGVDHSDAAQRRAHTNPTVLGLMKTNSASAFTFTGITR
jgi:hypothetical protein